MATFFIPRGHLQKRKVTKTNPSTCPPTSLRAPIPRRPQTHFEQQRGRVQNRHYRIQKKKGVKPKAASLQKPGKEEKEAIPLSLEEELEKVATESNARLSGNGAHTDANPPKKLEPKAPPKFVELPDKDASEAVVAPQQTLPQRGISGVKKIPPKPQPAPEHNLDQDAVTPKTPSEHAPEHNLDQDAVTPKTPSKQVSPKVAQTQQTESGPETRVRTQTEDDPDQSPPDAWEFGPDDGSATPEHLVLPIVPRNPKKLNPNLERCMPRPDFGAIPYMPFLTANAMSPEAANLEAKARAHQKSSLELADAYQKLTWGNPTWHVRSEWGEFAVFFDWAVGLF